MKYLSQQQLEQFQRDGYLVIPNFLTNQELADVKADIGRVCQEKAHLTKDEGGFNVEKVGGDAFDHTKPALRAGMLRKIQGAVFYVPAVRRVFTSKKMVDCMEDIMGPNIYYHSSKVMFKPANGGSPKPWHQDAAYWKNYEPNQITVWIAIDDATEENGCVWAIPGSHKLGLVPHVSRELQVPESQLDLKKAVPVPVQSGGLLIFHSLVLHMSKANTSDKPRCAIICDYDPAPNPTIDAYPREGFDPTKYPGMSDNKVWTLRAGKAAELAVA
jgi:ectoine hydroxylase-related dioxygenase (phytanoyl-CoA dioxygenase family)